MVVVTPSLKKVEILSYLNKPLYSFCSFVFIKTQVSTWLYYVFMVANIKLNFILNVFTHSLPSRESGLLWIISMIWQRFLMMLLYTKEVAKSNDSREVTKSYLIKKSENNILFLKTSKKFQWVQTRRKLINEVFIYKVFKIIYLQINVFLPELYWNYLQSGAQNFT